MTGLGLLYACVTLYIATTSKPDGTNKTICRSYFQTLKARRYAAMVLAS